MLRAIRCRTAPPTRTGRSWPGVPPVTPAAVLAEQYSGTYTQSALSRWVWVNTNLPGDWTAVATNTADGAGFFEFIDADTLNFPIRFYLVRSP